MKINGTFVTIIIVLMALMILFELNAPARFNWYEAPHSYDSKQPFGCYVMDSVLRASLPQGYEVCGEANISEYILNSSEEELPTFLLTNDVDAFIYDLGDTTFLQLINQGHTVVLAIDDYDYLYYDSDYNSSEYQELEEQFGFSLVRIDDVYDYVMEGASDYKEIMSDTSRYDTVYWHADERFDTATYMLSSAFCRHKFGLSSSFRTLVTLKKPYLNYRQEGDTVAAIRDFGKGKLVVVSMPMIFTNYGILDDSIRTLLLRILSECGDKPVVRYDIHYRDDGTPQRHEESPLRYLLNNRPLRWAFYLALATLVAFVAFSARRRQRIIPVIKPPVNHMMDFVKRIGGIYYKRHDNVDLLTKKYVTFSNDLRVKAMIDIDNFDYLDDELTALSSRTGIPLSELQQHIHDVKEAMQTYSISDKRLQQLIDVMNDIMHRINI